MEKNTELEINLVDLFFYLKKRIVIIVAAILICAIAGFLGTSLFMTPEYTAATRIYVLNRTSDAGLVYADFQVSTQVLNDYKVLITGQNVTKKVIAKLQLDMKPGELSKMITVTAPENTRVVQINIVDTDPERAALIANTVREEAAEQIKQIMNVDAVTLVYAADVPTAPSSASASRNAILAAAIGMVVAIGVLTLLFIWDDTIRTEDDVERYLGLSTLGVIPMSSELGTVKKSKSAKRFRLMRKK